MDYQDLLTYIDDKQFIWQYIKESADGIKEISRPYLCRIKNLGKVCDITYYDKDQEAQGTFRIITPKLESFDCVAKGKIEFFDRNKHNGFVSYYRFYEV